MQIVISNTAGVPIYEQIIQQVKDAILAGEVKEGEQLPSIRGLAKDLRVSVITTQRAYSELAAAGFVANVPGKGFFALGADEGLAREQILREVEQHLDDAAAKARVVGLTPQDLHSMLDTLLEEES